MKSFLLAFTIFLGAVSLFSQDTCNFQIDVGPDLNFFADEVYQLEVLFDVPPAEIGGFNWTPPDFLSCTDCQAPTATPEEPICYIVTVTDTTGCALSDTLCIGMPNSVSNHLISDELTVFPNPARDQVLVQSSGASIQQILLVNGHGEQVWVSRTAPMQALTIGLETLAAGPHWLVITTDAYTTVRPLLIQSD